MRETPRSAGHSRIAFIVLLAGLLVFLAGGAAFAQAAWPIYASSGGGGSISPAGTVYVPDGAAALFSFIPAPGYMVDQVIVDGNVVAVGVPAITLQAVHAQHSVLVTFTPAGVVPDYGGVVVAPGPDLYLFGGGFERRRDVHEFSRRGAESRASAHHEMREAPRGGGERGGRR